MPELAGPGPCQLWAAMALTKAISPGWVQVVSQEIEYRQYYVDGELSIFALGTQRNGLGASVLDGR